MHLKSILGLINAFGVLHSATISRSKDENGSGCGAYYAQPSLHALGPSQPGPSGVREISDAPATTFKQIERAVAQYLSLRLGQAELVTRRNDRSSKWGVGTCEFRGLGYLGTL